MSNPSPVKLRFKNVRDRSEQLSQNLITEDFSIQPVDFVSPPKWHLAHVTWFWEQFVLRQFKPDYKVFSEDFAFLFNSYYNNLGKRVLRPIRGLMSRPSVAAVMEYRAYVDEQMEALFDSGVLTEQGYEIIETGINHEEQHQELFLYDIKYILGHQPGFPAYGRGFEPAPVTEPQKFHKFESGLYDFGYQGSGFCFDNELMCHKMYLNDFEIAHNPVTNGEFLEFMNDGGYENFNFWHDEGWHWINNNQIKAPHYWHKVDGAWHYYDLDGFKVVESELPVNHVSFYEAFAFAEWKGMRLPTEFEWELACGKLHYGSVWEWTNSAYLPYPGFQKAPGALGEYNGKFMVNQMVMRGSSAVTPPGHSRPTYRNFFHPNMRWQYAGFRLAKPQTL